MNKDLLKEYYKLELKFRELENEKKLLRDSIVEDFRKNKLDKVESDFGSFTICEKKSWKYSEKIKSLEDKVKIAKDKEQRKGIAEASITNYLLFKENQDATSNK